MRARVFALLAAVAALAAGWSVRRESHKGVEPGSPQPETLFREFAASLPDIQFVTDDHGLNPQFNPRWHEYTGLPEHCSRDPHLNEAVHPADRQRVLDSWHLAVASGSPFEARYRLRSADGRHRWFIVRARPVGDGRAAPRWFGTATDIDAQMRAEEALRDREEQLRLALESTGLGIFEIEYWTRRMIWSDRCRSIWGLSTDASLEFTAIRRAIDPRDRSRVVAGINRSRDPNGSGEFAFEARVLRSDGSERVIAARGRSFFTQTADGERAIRCVGTMLDVTERRMAEQRLARSEQRLELAQEAAEVGMWDYDIPTRNLQWSRTLYRMHGRIPGSGPENTERIFLDSIVEADRGRVQQEVREAVKHGTHYASEYRIVRGDGQVRWLASRGRVERGADGSAVRFIGVSIDITMAKAAEHRLLESEELFRLAAEAVNGIIYDHDPIRGTVRRTRGLYEVAGYRPEEIPSTHGWWIGLIHPDDRERAQRALATRLASGATRLEVEYRIRHQLGHWVHVLDRCYLVRDDAGRTVRIVGCTQDVTGLRQAEQSLREADRRKDEFLAVLAHELRNPLAPIRSAVAIMRRAPPGSDAIVAQARDMLDRQVAHMVRLIDDLLDVGRITSGKLALRKEVTSLKAVIDSALETARPLLDAGGHALTVSLSEPPPQLTCDPDRLSQVVGNLLTNAAKYTPPGGRIELRADVQGAEVCIRVRDNGIGIAPDSIPSVFDMFSQIGRRPGDDRHAGLGVGLPLARALTALHGGTVEAASAGPGQGTEMLVRLPMNLDPAMSESNSKPPAGRSSTTAPRRVLVVDDNEDAADSLAALLQLSGHEVMVAYDGRQALEAAEQFRPEVVLLDVSMPRMDGHEAARRLRATDWGKSIYIVALSGFGQEQDRARSLAAGCNAHLIKPVAPTDLDDVMAGAVSLTKS
jgi:PAS domain S-box-containing protein